MMMAGELIADYLERARSFEPERYPVLNAEPRVQLDPRLWHLIHERDGGICWMCSRHVAKGDGEVDHLVPRSSFLPDEVVTAADRSWNLRLACVACNRSKSNYTVLELPRTFGITHRCPECVEVRGPGSADVSLWPFMGGALTLGELTEPAYCGSCGFVTRVPGKEWML